MQDFKPPGVPITAGEPGYNEYGCPISRCYGKELNEHYWSWITHKISVDKTKYSLIIESL